MNLSALPLVLGVYGLVRMCRIPRVWKAFETKPGPLPLTTRRHS